MTRAGQSPIISSTAPSRGDRGAVICPTPRGGHIEHAFELAVALARTTGAPAVVFTRPGAREYLPPSELVVIDEVLAPLPTTSNKILKALHHAAVLLTEPFLLSRRFRRFEITTVVLEEPRYATLKMFRFRTSVRRIVLMMHNATPHRLSSTDPLEGLRTWIADRTVSGVDEIIVHGSRQQRTLRELYSRDSRAFPLPTSSFLDGMRGNEPLNAGPPSGDAPFICLGELRENKGLEFSIAAAAVDEQSLVIAGHDVDPTYVDRIRKLAANVPTVSLRESFLSTDEFDSLLRSSRGLLLSYSQFDAQSGLLSKGMALGKYIIASDLDALREQAGSYDRIEFVDPTNVRDFSAALGRVPLISDPSRNAQALDAGDLLTQSVWDEMAQHALNA